MKTHLPVLKVSRFAPHFFAVKLDETEYWNPSIVKKAGRVLGLYIFNYREETYVASLTPSLWLEYIGFEAEKQISENVYDQMIDASGEDASNYFGVRMIENLPLKASGFFGPCRIDLKKEFPALHKQWEDIEEAREYLQANWSL